MQDEDMLCLLFFMVRLQMMHVFMKKMGEKEILGDNRYGFSEDYV